MKRNLVIDWILVPAFILSGFSGIKFHVAGHCGDHEILHNWGVFHIIVSLLFLSCGIYHIKVHKGWFKNLLKQGLGKKSRITVATSVLFCVVVVSGLSLLFVDGGNSTLGLAHYKIGLVAIVLFLFHVISRMKVLRKSLKM